MLEQVIPKALEKSLKKGKVLVGSIEGAKNCIANEKEPLCIQFITSSLGREDIPEINKLEESVKEKDIFIFWDEVDFLVTKKERLEMFSRLIKTNRKTNAGQFKPDTKQVWYREHEKKRSF